MQNPSQIHPKYLKNRSKIAPKNPNALQMRPKSVFLFIFCNFLSPRSLSKSSQNRQNPQKNVQKSMSKKRYIFTRFFIDFSSFWLAKMDQTWTFFWKLLKTSIFWELAFRLDGNTILEGSTLQKNILKRCQNTLEQKHRNKNFSKIDFYIDFSLPKTSPNPLKIETNRKKQSLQKKIQKKRLPNPA